MKTDRELLELAAKAIGLDLVKYSSHLKDDWIDFWNPLTDDGDALRLAVKLRMHSLRIGSNASWIEGDNTSYYSHKEIGSPERATRLAIVRCAAEIGAKL